MTDGLVNLVVVNATLYPAALFWFDGDERSVQYGEPLAPGQSKEQQTFVNHTWQLRNCTGNNAGPSNAVLLEVKITTGTEPEQTLMLLPADSSALPGTASDDAVKAGAAASEDFYSQVCEVGVAGLRVRASAEVCGAALSHAADVARHMLQRGLPSVLQRLQARQCSISVIGRAQKTSDIPEHREWALTAQRPDEEVLKETAPEAEPDLAAGALAIERSERAEALASRLAHLPPDTLCGLICGLVKEGIISDVAFLSALPPVQATGDAAAPMAATECSAACDQAAAPVSPPPPPQATTCSPDGRREAGKLALELAMGDGNRDGAVGGAVCADGAEGREAVAAAARDRGVDGTTRGVGGGQVVSVGEENLVRELETDPHYPDESILVHEFGEPPPLPSPLLLLPLSTHRLPSPPLA